MNEVASTAYTQYIHLHTTHKYPFDRVVGCMLAGSR